jgi:hypothetical protein
MGSRAWLGVTLLLVACSDDSGGRFFPGEDGAQSTDATVTDAVSTDIVSTDIVSADVPADRGAPVDRSVPVDRGPNRCPSGCATNSDCAPCAERAGELFCCISGLCVFTSEPMCVATPDGGGVNPDGGGDGGNDGAANDTSGNPFDDTPEPDSGSMMPEDVPSPPADLGVMDGGARSDVVNDLAGDTAG